MGIETYKLYDLIRSGNFIYTVKYSDEEKTLIYESPGNIPTSSCRLCNSFEIDLYFSQNSDYICIKDYLIPGSGIIRQNNIISFLRKNHKGFFEIKFGKNETFLLSKDEMFNHFRLYNSSRSINLSEFPEQIPKKSFPEEGFCKTTNKTLIDHICSTREVAKGSSFNLRTHIGIGWNSYSCWTVIASSSKTEYKEEELLSLLGITVECPSGQVLKFINNQSNINQLNQNQDGAKTNRVVPRVTTGDRTTGTTVSSRTSKHSITVGHPSNQTVYC